jgi:hypothetical protein
MSLDNKILMILFEIMATQCAHIALHLLVVGRTNSACRCICEQYFLCPLQEKCLFRIASSILYFVLLYCWVFLYYECAEPVVLN